MALYSIPFPNINIPFWLIDHWQSLGSGIEWEIIGINHWDME